MIGITDRVTVTVPPDEFFLFRLRYPRYLQSLIPAIQGYVSDSLLKYEQLGVEGY